MMNPEFKTEWYHELLAEKLQAWAEHRITRLIITLPPRHGKTEMAARMLPAWLLGLNPRAKILASSGEQLLANQNSRDVQRIIQSENYESVFGSILGGKQREDYFETASTGYYNARSVGSGISGRGADYFIIDDYFPNQEAANSPTTRGKLWDWYNSDALTRLHYPASILVMATRWHHDDLIGRLLQAPDAADYEVIHVPKIYDWRPDEAPEWDPREPGEPLISPASDRGTTEFFAGEEIPAHLQEHAIIVDREDVKARVAAEMQKLKARAPKTASALYQGRPTPQEGGLFAASNFHAFAAHPQSVAEKAERVIISIDPAFKAGKHNDPTGILVAAVAHNKLFIIDDATDKMEFPDLVEHCLALYDKYPNATLLVEEKAAGASLIQALRRRLPRVIAFNPTPYGDKAQRAQYAADRYASEGILHPENRFAPWLALFEEELKQFPHGTHDDRVDALSQMVIFLDQKQGGRHGLNRTLRLIPGGR